MELQLINKVFDKNSIENKVASMLATSHEYKIPRQLEAIRLVGNYKWEKRRIKLNKIEGINKPVIKEKVFNIAKSINPKTATPLMVVDAIQGITPQSPGKVILIDGHHRKEAYELLGIDECDVYYGKYVGHNEKSLDEIVKTADVYSKEIEKIAKKKTTYQKLRENRVNLTPEERAIVKSRKAVWSDGSSGVWKSINPKDGKVTYVSNTHRAMITAPTLKGAISKFPFIKSTS